MKLSITLTTVFVLLANSSHAQVEVCSCILGPWTIPQSSHSHALICCHNLFQTPNLRAYVNQVAAEANRVSCDASKEVSGSTNLVGCSKVMDFARKRVDGPCNGGYSYSFALKGFHKAGDCANACMADEELLSTLLGFDFDCDTSTCKWWVDISYQSSRSKQIEIHTSPASMCWTK